MGVKTILHTVNVPIAAIEATCHYAGVCDKLTVQPFDGVSREPLLTFRKNIPLNMSTFDKDAYTSVMLTLDDADAFADSIKKLVAQERANPRKVR